MKKLSINSLLVFTIFLFCGFSSYSQAKFYAIADVSKVEKGKIFQISYVLENAEIKDIIMPEFTNFDVLGSPSRSNEMSVINGVSKSKMTYTYKINPLKTGKHKIGSAKIITTNNKNLVSNELTIEVLSSSLSNRIKPEKNTNFFIITEISDKTLYPGQQVLLKYKLYTTERPAGIRNEYIPDFKGFKNIPIEYEFPMSIEKINNITYHVYTISSVALFALKQGNFKYEPAKFFIELRDGNSQDIFFQTVKSYSLTSEPVEFKVSPLPSNPPKGYSGIVGIVNITSGLKKQSVSDEVYVFTLNIESDCEKNSLTAPDIKDFFPDFEIFDPKLVFIEELFHSGKLMVRKSFEYILVPKKPGIYDISMPFIYFNTEENNYVTFKTKSEKIEVKASSIKKTSLITNNDVSEIEPFKNNIKLKKNTKPLFFTLSYWLLLISLLLIFPFLYYFKLQNDKQKKIDPIVAKTLKAKSNADKKLNRALKLLKENKEYEFYNEIYSVLISYAADKFKLTNYESNKENIKLKLSESGLSDETISEYIDLVNNAEMYVYSGHTISSMNELYTKTSEILNRTQKFV